MHVKHSTHELCEEFDLLTLISICKKSMFETLAKILQACEALYELSLVGDPLSPSIVIRVVNAGTFVAGLNGAMNASSKIRRLLGLVPMAQRPIAKYCCSSRTHANTKKNLNQAPSAMGDRLQSYRPQQ